MTDIAAVLGLGQLQRLDSFNAERTALASNYLAALKSIPGLQPLAPTASSNRHAWHLFIVRVEAEQYGLDRDEFMAAMKERQIGTGLHFKAVHSQKFYRDNLSDCPSLPNTDYNSQRIVSLPLFPGMSAAEQQRVIDAMAELGRA